MLASLVKTRLEASEQRGEGEGRGFRAAGEINSVVLKRKVTLCLNLPIVVWHIRLLVGRYFFTSSNINITLKCLWSTNDCCLFERLCNVKKNGVFLF